MSTITDALLNHRPDPPLTPRQLANQAKREAAERAERIAAGKRAFTRDPEFERRAYNEWMKLHREQHGIESLDPGDRARLVGALQHFADVNEGERSNAADAVERIRAKLGIEWKDLIVP